MQTDITSRANQLVFGIVKLCGYVFYSFDHGGIGNGIKFKQTYIDYVIFAISVSFSITSCYCAESQFENNVINSDILKLGVALVTRIFLASLVYTKCYNFFFQVHSFEALIAFYWIENKVVKLHN